MVRYLILKHYINGKETFDEYQKGIVNINSAIDISNTHNLGFQFGLKLAVDENLDKDLIAEVKLVELPDIWFLYDPKNRGPGTSYRQILFNPTFSPVTGDSSLVISADLDQYAINTQDALNQLAEFAERVETNKSLYATGSRDIPVVLATSPRNSDLRVIHELFHSLIIGSEKLRTGEQKTNVTPAYHEIGESTSGLYIINFSHPSYPELTGCVVRASQSVDLRGFATDYYTAIKSAELGELERGYVQSKENIFYTKKNPDEEFVVVKRYLVPSFTFSGKVNSP